MDKPIPLVVDLRERLLAARWTVRKLKAEGFGTKSAEILLGKAEGVPDLPTAERALALLKPPRRLWHAKA